MTEAQLEALRTYVEAAIARAIESAFGRDSLYESIAEREAYEALQNSIKPPDIMQP